MKTHHVISALLLLLFAGCDAQDAIVNPNEHELVGIWVPNRQHSNCPPFWMAANTALVIKADGTCEARNFGKGVFEQNYTQDQDKALHGVVNGSWMLKKDGRKWQLAFRWSLDGRVFDQEASLVGTNKKTEIEFWIGNPDPYPRLLLQKGPGD